MQSNNSVLVATLVLMSTILSHLTGIDQVQFLWFLEWSAGFRWHATLKCKPGIPPSQKSWFCLKISPIKRLLLVSHSKMSNTHDKRPCIHRRLNYIICKYIHAYVATYIYSASFPAVPNFSSHSHVLSNEILLHV